LRLFSEINHVVELCGAGHRRLLGINLSGASDNGWAPHAQSVCLFVANLIVGDKSLELIDKLSGTQSGLV
ncbi:MAG: hypothetical protein WAK48_06045, partial [Candidatus Acidiferrum sp.]